MANIRSGLNDLSGLIVEMLEDGGPNTAIGLASAIADAATEYDLPITFGVGSIRNALRRLEGVAVVPVAGLRGPHRVVWRAMTADERLATSGSKP